MGENGPAGYTPREIWQVVGVLMVGTFLSTLDVLIIVTALPRISGDLGGGSDISWTLTAYMLSSTATGPIYGKLGDLVGRKVLYQVAIAIFVAGSLLCGLSQDVLQLTLSRAIQGIGAGGLMVLPFAMIAEVSSPRERARYQSLMTVNFAVATVLGPLAGGFAIDHATWRWIFLANVPLGLLALVATARLRLPAPPQVKVVVDVVGSALLVAAAVCSLFLVTWAGERYGLLSPPILGLAAGTAALAVLLVAWERRAPEPVLPLDLFRNSRFDLLTSGIFFAAIAMNGGWVLMPLFLQIVTGASATNSGLLLLPFVLGNSTAALAAGKVISRTGRYKWSPVLGATIASAGFFLYTTLDPDSSRLLASAYMLVSGIGIGFILQVTTVMVQNSVEPRHLGAATAAIGFFRSLGLAVGAALAINIYSSRLAHELGRLDTSALPDAALRGDPVAIQALPPALAEPLVTAFADALRFALLVTAPMALVGLVLFLLTRDIERDDEEGADAVAGAAAIGSEPLLA